MTSKTTQTFSTSTRKQKYRMNFSVFLITLFAPVIRSREPLRCRFYSSSCLYYLAVYFSCSLDSYVNNYKYTCRLAAVFVCIVARLYYTKKGQFSKPKKKSLNEVPLNNCGLFATCLVFVEFVAFLCCASFLPPTFPVSPFRPALSFEFIAIACIQCALLSLSVLCECDCVCVRDAHCTYECACQCVRAYRIASVWNNVISMRAMSACMGVCASV